MIAAFLVFASVALLDFIWTKYIYATTKRRPFVAGGYASAIILCSGVAAIGYVNDPLMLIPAMAGAFCGTYFAVAK